MNDELIVENLDRLMRTIDAQMHKHAPAVDDENIGPLGAITLKHLSTLAPTPTNALVSALGRDPSQVSRIIKRLEAKGLISRREDGTDKRVSMLDVTDKGACHLKKLDVVLSRVVEELLAPLGADERKALGETLKKLVR